MKKKSLVPSLDLLPSPSIFPSSSAFASPFLPCEPVWSWDAGQQASSKERVTLDKPIVVEMIRFAASLFTLTSNTDTILRSDLWYQTRSQQVYLQHLRAASPSWYNSWFSPTIERRSALATTTTTTTTKTYKEQSRSLTNSGFTGCSLGEIPWVFKYTTKHQGKTSIRAQFLQISGNPQKWLQMEPQVTQL